MQNRKEDKKQAEELWARNKYLVLSKSHAYYIKIRDYLKRDDANVDGVERFISKALALNESKKDVINAYQHIWGYFKNDASGEEKQVFLELLNKYKDNQIKKEEVLNYLKSLLAKYPNQYLENSTIFN